MERSDVVVIGSGVAGLSAGLTAAAHGASVTVLEKSSLFGGTSAVSGGGMWLPGNRLDPDFTDDLVGARRYLAKLTLGMSSDAVLDRFLAEAGAVPAFFSQWSPLTFTADIGRPDYHAPWDGSSETSRTVFAAPYEMPRLGAMDARVRRPGPGGIVPIQHSEERDLAGKGEDAINELIRERLAKGIALRGLALVGGLIEGCLDRGVQFVSDTRAREILVEDGRVTGVRATRGDDETRYAAGQGVILAAGGYEWNRDMWTGFMGVPWDVPATPPVNEGDSIVLVSRLGAKLANLDKATWIQTRYMGEEYDGQPYVRSGLPGGYAGEIMVNRRGRRFANENLNYNDIGRVMTAFDPHVYEFVNHPAFAIGDRRGLARAASRPSMVVGGEIGADRAQRTDGDGYVEAATLRDVAAGLGIDADGLERQVAEFNAGAAAGTDPVFHRGEKSWEVHVLPDLGLKNRALAPIVEPPFYGYRVRTSVFGTRGGPVTNEHAEIVDYENGPIPGLFGAGNAVAHPFGPAYPGGGGTLGPGITFGHVAGRRVLAGS